MKKSESIAMLLRLSEDISLETAVFQQKAAAQAGLSINDMRALSIIYRENSIDATTLSQKLHITNGAVTGIVERLVSKNLIKRYKAQDDARRTLLTSNLHIAHASSTTYEKIGEAHSALLKTYSADELRLLMDYSQKILELTKLQSALLQHNI